MTGFVILSREVTRRRIPFWIRVERPRLPLDRKVALARPGEYAANTSRGAARVSSYRYPDVLPGHAAFPVRLTGREIVYRVHIRRRIANFGVAVIARNRGVVVEPRVVRNGDENRLAGYTALPFDQNPYRPGFGRHRLVAGVALPGLGVYDIVFDTPRGARSGGFRFRFWQGDVRPPSVRVLGVRNGFLELAVLTAAPESTRFASGAHRRELRPSHVWVRPGAPVLGRRCTRPAHAELHSRRLSGDEEHGERRADPAEHPHGADDLRRSGPNASGRFPRSSEAC